MSDTEYVQQRNNSSPPFWCFTHRTKLGMKEKAHLSSFQSCLMLFAVGNYSAEMFWFGYLGWILSLAP